MTTSVVEYYHEKEPYNLRPITSNITYTCNCGGKVIRLVAKEENFGKQGFCPLCNNLLYTISKKITWREYVSGKTQG